MHSAAIDFVRDIYPTLDRERRIRVDLAAAYNLVEHFGMSDSIYTHISARLPGQHDRFLINPYGTRFDEVTASNLVTIDLHGNILDDPFNMGANPAGFTIHSAVHAARRDIECALHTHTVAGVAISSTTEGILPLNQWSMQFHERVSRHPYEGIALNLAERERLVKDLGPLNKILILDNHGLMTLGSTVGEAFTLMFNLERSCQTQLAILSSGMTIQPVADDICRRTATQYKEFAELSQRNGFHAEWLAYLRHLEKVAPHYRT